MASDVTNNYNAFLRDEDQASREAELRDFIGPNADKFLPVYRGLRPGPNGRPQIRFFGSGFVAGAFFGGPTWFFYRKLWAVAWTITGLLIFVMVLAYAFPTAPISRLGFIVSMVLALSAKRLYMTHAVQQLGRLRQANGVLEPVAVRAAGGVSRTAAWISGSIYGFFTLLGLVATIWLIKQGIPPS